MPRPLAGIVVADFSRILAGPLCTMLLGDAGARIVKIEEPRGDETRRWGPPFVNGVSAYFLSVNRGKESLSLNLKTAAGRKIAKDLVRRADVVIDNFLPQQREGVGLANVRRVNRSAIHLSIAGFDSATSDAATPGYDLLAQAGAGLMAISGPADGDPMKVGVALSDVLTAHHAFGAINAALFAREKSGRGARLEVSLFSSTLASLVNVAQNALVTGREAKRYGNAHPSIVPYQLFRAADRPFAIGAGTDRHFASLCSDVIERAELASDPRFATNAARVENRATLVPMLDAIFATKPARVWIGRMRKAAVPCSPVQGPLEALSSDAAGDLVGTLSHPLAGDYRFVSYPVLSDGKRMVNRKAPPLHGEHTDALLRELGYARDAIARLRQRGVV